jgi:hypothetical protein
MRSRECLVLTGESEKSAGKTGKTAIIASTPVLVCP